MTKLQVTLEGDHEIHMVREFAAPKHLLIKAMMQPELIKRWLGNSCSPLIEIENDGRVGGKYRQVFRNRDGSTFSFTGTYLEVTDDKIVFTQAFNDLPHPATITTTYIDHGNGTTTMKIVMRFDLKEIRDQVVASGMEVGAGESYDNLEALARSL